MSSYWLTERDGGTLLRVIESGFEAIAAAAGNQTPFVTPEGNLEGWTYQLDIVKARAEHNLA